MSAVNTRNSSVVFAVDSMSAVFPSPRDRAAEIVGSIAPQLLSGEFPGSESLTEEELSCVIQGFQDQMEKYFDENPNGPELSLGTQVFSCFRLVQEIQGSLLSRECPKSSSPLPKLI